MRTSPALLALASLLLAASAQAADGDAACCLQTTSRLNSILDPVAKGSGDEQFFTSRATKPNVLILIDESINMHAWPVSWAKIWQDQASQRGCTSPTLNGLGFNPTGTYTPSSESEFDPTKFYGVGETACMSTKGGGTCTPYGDAATACVGLGAGCSACLTDRGFYLENAATVRVSGKFALHYKPRDTMVRDLLLDISKVTRLADVRQGWIGTNAQENGAIKSTPWNATKCINLMNKASEPVIVPTCTGDPGNIAATLNMIAKKMSFDTATSGCGFPLPDMLYAGAHFLRGAADKSAKDPFSAWFGNAFPTSAAFNAPTNGEASMCGSCNFNAVIAITAGTVSKAGSIIPPPAALGDATENPCSGCTELEKMTRWFWTHDLRTDTSSVTYGTTGAHYFPGRQNMATYFVALSDETDPAVVQLKRAAKRGGGEVYYAQTGDGLIKALDDTLTNVITRSTSFSAASVSFLQNATTVINAIMPRMKPAKAPDPWEGLLWHFRLYNEFVQENDLNADGDKDDVFITDKNSNVVVENSDGHFVNSTTNTLITPADVDWEASEKLKTDGYAGRKIWTVVDSGAKDGQLTEEDALVSFDKSKVATLLPYLGIGITKKADGSLVGGREAKRDGDFYCPSFSRASDGTWSIAPGALLNALNLTVQEAGAAVGKSITWFSIMTDPEGVQGELNELCGMVVIQYVRGQDLRDDDYDGSRTDTRPTIFGDIFHSSPVTVTPPVDAFLCDLGLSNQCVRTLYADQLGSGVSATPQAVYATGEKNCADQDVTRKAYEKYSWTWRKRQELVLVGANDGMLHAFDNGSFIAGSDTCEGGLWTGEFDKGTGREVWAFIPPDLLPRLAETILQHNYLVDGDIMVRDIWNDDNHDGKKQYDEYRTVAVTAEGRGGTHYFALELLFDASTGAALDRPGFRWMFPQPCSIEATEFGKTLYSLSPKPPPIGPVLIDTDSSTGLANPAANPVERYGTDTQEQWVVALSGGWSPSLSLGRGVYFVDAYRGKVNGRDDNLWWKLAFDPNATGDVRSPLKEMRYSIVAPVALVDYGVNGNPSLDGFFDTAIVGDTGGQVWLARMSVPGRLDPSTGLIGNWSGARAFQQAKGTANAKSRFATWYLASTALQSDYGYLRTYFGGGDRYAVLEKYAGTCNFYNPLSCAKYGCTDVTSRYELDRPTMSVDTSMDWDSASLNAANSTRSYSALSGSACGAASARYSAYHVNACPGPTNHGELVQTRVDCSKPGSYYTCNRTDSAADKYNDLIGGTSTTVPSSTTLTGLGKPRFYGAWVYGGTRTFEEDWTGGAGKPADYDAARITDTDLTNTTETTCTATVCTGNQATSTGKGWFVEYHDTEPPTNASLEHKTATGAAVMSSCVLWNTIHPIIPVASGTDCGVFIKSKGRIYQGDFITGAPNCAFSFMEGDTYARYQERNVLAPPPEPATVVQISKSGQIKYSAMLLEPGASQATDIGVSQSSDMLQTIYELPVSRALHECRHGNKDNCKVQAP